MKREQEPNLLVVGHAGNLTESPDLGTVSQTSEVEGTEVQHYSTGMITFTSPGTPRRSRKKKSRSHGTKRQWSKEDNTALMMAFYQSQPGKRGYRKRLHTIWTSLNIFPCSEQQLADQSRSVITKKLLPDMELVQFQRTAATSQINPEMRQNSTLQSPASDSELSFTVPPPTPPKAHSTPLLSPKPATMLHTTCDSEVSFNILAPSHTPPQISQLEEQPSLIFSGYL